MKYDMNNYATGFQPIVDSISADAVFYSLSAGSVIEARAVKYSSGLTVVGTFASGQPTQATFLTDFPIAAEYAGSFSVTA